MMSRWPFQQKKVLLTIVLRNATYVDDIVLQGIDSVNLFGKNNVHIFVYIWYDVQTVWYYVQRWSEEGIDVGLIYLFMKLPFIGLKRHLSSNVVEWAVSV